MDKPALFFEWRVLESTTRHGVYPETVASTSFLCSFVIPGPSGNFARFLPTLILVERILEASSAVKGGQSNSL